MVAVEVAVLGTGAIGTGMARSLIRAGHAGTVWNRTAERARPPAADGAHVARLSASGQGAQDMARLAASLARPA